MSHAAFDCISYNSSEAKASRVIICTFPVKLPFPVHSGLQRASKSRHVHSNRTYGRPVGIPSSAHVSIRIRSIGILFSAWFAFTVMTTALDSDERLHSDVGLKQEKERTTQRTYARRR